MARESESCAVCSRRNELSCPSCDRPAQRQWIDGIMIDICEKCKGAWFDHVELRHIWKLKFTEIARRSAAISGGDVLVDSFLWAPDLAANTIEVAASGIGHAASALGDAAVGGGAEIASGALSFVGEAAESVFEAIAEILGGLFS